MRGVSNKHCLLTFFIIHFYTKCQIWGILNNEWHHICSDLATFDDSEYHMQMLAGGVVYSVDT